MSDVIDIPCSHCGLESKGVFPKREDALSFCCKGCETVYLLLKENNLDEFYQLNSKFSQSAPNTSADSNNDLAYLDDPIFLEKEGFNQREMTFYLEGIHCVACLWIIEKLPELTQGVESAQVNMSLATVKVKLRPNGNFSDAARTLALLGYPAHSLRNEREREKHVQAENRAWLLRLGISGALTMNIMILTVAIYLGAEGFWERSFNYLSFALSVPVLTYAAMPFYKSALGSLRHKTLSIDVPIALAILLGGGLSLISMASGWKHIYFDSLSSLVFLLLSSRYFLKRIHQRSLNSQRFLSALTPYSAEKFDEDTGEFVTITSDALLKGDRIRVEPGAFIPTDGTLLSQEARVDASTFSGESEEILFLRNDPLFGGYKNLINPIELTVTCPQAKSRLGEIIEKIKTKNPLESNSSLFADKLAKYFVAATLVFSALIFSYFLLNGKFQIGFERSLAFIIVLCPCALALATPLVYALSLNKALKNGIVIKSANSLEYLTQSKTLFFDKTGTLTDGNLTVTKISYLESDTNFVDHLLLALEKPSAHPIAKTICNYLSPQGPARYRLENWQESLGKGVSGIYKGNTYEVKATDGELDNREIGLHVGLYENATLIATVKLIDSISQETKSTLDNLRSRGYIIKMITGDKSEHAHRVGNILGIAREDIYSEKTPEQKLLTIQASKNTCMIGDGANDAFSLKEADVGIAVQGSLEVSLNAADVIVTKSGLNYVENLLKLSKETHHITRRNFALSIVYNLTGGILAMNGLITPLAAAILMPLSSLTVFLSSIIATREFHKL